MVEENFGAPLKNETSSIGTFPCYICEKCSIGWLVFNNGIDNEENLSSHPWVQQGILKQNVKIEKQKQFPFSNVTRVYS